jgi:hypothetical protein
MDSTKSLTLINQQCKILQYKLSLTDDPQQIDILSKRLTNLLAVMEFLVTMESNPTSPVAPE